MVEAIRVSIYGHAAMRALELMAGDCEALAAIRPSSPEVRVLRAQAEAFRAMVFLFDENGEYEIAIGKKVKI